MAFETHMKNLLNSILFAFSLFLVACGTASTLTTKPNENNYKSAYIQIQKIESEVVVLPENQAAFEEELKSQLYFKDGSFYKGDGLTLSYQFLSFNPGDRVKRFASLGNNKAAEGTLVIAVTFTKPNGKEVATMEAHAYIKGGILGGSINDALEKAAREIAQYSKLNFK